MAIGHRFLIGIVISVLFSGGFYFERFYLHPSPSLIHYIQLVTINDPWKPDGGKEVVQNQSSTSPTPISAGSGGGSTTGQPTRASVTTSPQAISSPQDHRMETAGGGGTVGGANERGGQPVAAADESRVPAAGQEEFQPPLRFNSKLHMINPLQLFTDYPVAWFLCVKMGFARLSWVSANLISAIHPLFGLAAGILIYRSAKGSFKDAATQGPAAAAAAAAQTVKENNNNSPTALGGSTEMKRCSSTIGVGGGMVLSPKYGGGFDSGVEDGGSMMGSPQGSLNGNEGQALVEIGDENPSGKNKVAYMQLPVDMFLLRMGCCLFSFRNFLDSLDGVIARLQRRYRAEAAVGAVSTPAPADSMGYGFNGHSIDVVTDLFGVIMCSVGIFFFMMRRGTVLSRYSQMLVNVVSRGRLNKSQMSTAAKVVALGGLLFMAILGSQWEEYMMKYSNLFDIHSPTNPKIWELEQDPRLRLNQFFWSVTCGDSVFTVLIVALFFNKIWEAVQFYFFVGYPWFLMVILHSSYVWYWVVLENPAAYRIISQAQLQR